MVKIKFNQELFDKHISEITPKIKSASENVDRSSLGNETTRCLDYLLEYDNIKNLLKANTSELKEHIAYFKQHYPSSLENDSELNNLLRDRIFEREYKNWGTRTTYGAYTFVKELGLQTESV